MVPGLTPKISSPPASIIESTDRQNLTVYYYFTDIRKLSPYQRV